MRYHHNFQKAAKLSLCRVEPVIFWRRESGRHFSGKRVVMRRECVSPGATGSLIVIYNPQWPAGERPVLALRRPTRVFNFCLQELKGFCLGTKNETSVLYFGFDVVPQSFLYCTLNAHTSFFGQQYTIISPQLRLGYHS